MIRIGYQAAMKNISYQIKAIFNPQSREIFPREEGKNFVQ